MKKLIAMLLVMTMAIGFSACGTKTGGNETTAPTVQDVLPGSALEVLETIWNSYASEEKFFAMGGDYTNLVENGPGVYNLEDEGLSSTLLVPAEQVQNIDQAASLTHGMNLNNFTCGVFHITGDVNAFAKAMYDSISTNPWICGSPEKLIIAIIGGEYVLASFGIDDAMGPFETKLTAAYPGANLKYNEAIAG